MSNGGLESSSDELLHYTHAGNESPYCLTKEVELEAEEQSLLLPVKLLDSSASEVSPL